MRMLEIFSSEKTYLSVIPDANHVASLREQILHYMVQKGKPQVMLLLYCCFLTLSIAWKCVCVCVTALTVYVQFLF